MSDSIIVRLKPGLSRESAENSGTVCFSSARLPWTQPARLEIEDAFVRSYETIRAQYEALSGPGVVVAVLSPTGFEGLAIVSAKPETINVLTIGRHSHSNLFLSGDPSMSLRQGALIVYPFTRGEPVRFRILDLRASVPFVDERDTPFEALEADGPVFLRSGTNVFLIFPKREDAPAWPASPEEAWKAIPKRTYLEQVGLESADRARDVPPEGKSDGGSATLVLALPGPFMPSEKLLHMDEIPRGHLVIRCENREMRMVLGAAAVARGVLLGRDDRCDGSERAVLATPSISRVHALVIELAGKLYVVDAGSTNGVWHGHERVLFTRLATGDPVALSGTVATLEWGYSH
jgi:hypothetical protein